MLWSSCLLLKKNLIVVESVQKKKLGVCNLVYWTVSTDIQTKTI